MEVKRTGIVLKPNNSRVLFRPFEPATQERILKIIARIMSVSDQDVSALLADVMRDSRDGINGCRTFFWNASKLSAATC